MAASRQRPDPQKSLVGFIVGEVAYAIPIGVVRQIVNPLPVTALPHAPDVIAGVADHRGLVVPVIDLRRRFGLGPLADVRRAKWVLVAVQGRTVALVVDRVTKVFGTGGVGLRPAPELGNGDDRRGIAGVTTHDDALTFVLDVDSFAALLEPTSPVLPPRAERTP